MNIDYISGYLRGLMHMASYFSKNIGPSYFEVDAFDKNTFMEDFKKQYGVDLPLFESPKTFKEELSETFGDQEKAIVESIIYYMGFQLEEPTKVLRLKDNSLYEKIERKSIFSYLEDIFFVEFEECMVCYMVGNNE